jgi:hypothetical protein
MTCWAVPSRPYNPAVLLSNAAVAFALNMSVYLLIGRAVQVDPRLTPASPCLVLSLEAKM